MFEKQKASLTGIHNVQFEQYDKSILKYTVVIVRAVAIATVAIERKIQVKFIIGEMPSMIV